jgi:hypothetical protein
VKKYVVLLLLFLIIAPVTVSAANYLLGDRRDNWQTADRSSAGLLAQASEHPDALIRVCTDGTLARYLRGSHLDRRQGARRFAL